MTNEIEWRDVPGFDGKYQISISTKEGRCRNTNTGFELSVKPDRSGRLYWTLYGNGKTHFQAARWIALTYPELVQNEWFPGAEIDHIDTVCMNNHPSNLRWVTPKENSNNPLTKQHQSKGQMNRPDHSKRIAKLSLDNEILCYFPSTRQAGRDTGILSSSIRNCLTGRSKTAGKYKWKYVE